MARMMAISSRPIWDGPSSPMLTPTCEPTSFRLAIEMPATRIWSAARVKKVANVDANGTLPRVPNPTATALIRAGDLADRATYFRNDLNLPAANPHTFLTFGVGIVPGAQAQTQMAIFLASDGTLTVDPDGAGPLFEVPIAGPLPEELNF